MHSEVYSRKKLHQLEPYQVEIKHKHQIFKNFQNSYIHYKSNSTSYVNRIKQK